MTVLEPTSFANPNLPQSRLERIMSARAGVRLTQFGYDQMGVGRAVTLPQVGDVQDNYILGPGDEIVITLRGQDNTAHRVVVDRDGNVVLPRVSPVAAAGLRFGDFRAQLLAAIHSAYMATDAYISVGRLRQISVMVAGEVGSPGVRTLTGLSSPIDAILVSGGVRKTGSLRNIKLIHQGRTVSIDLYGYLTTGVSPRQVTLGDGDRIIVPPLAKVVAAAGWLRRPGIYEIPDGQGALSVRSLSNLAGGLEVRGRYRLAVMHIQADGQTQLVPVTSEGNLVRDGEILMALPGADQVVDRATLAGGTSLAGGYSIKNGAHLSEILKEPGALGTSPYTVFGIISRRDPRTYLRSLIAFSPVAALSGDFDPTLMSGDVVRIISMRESRLLSRSLKIYAALKRYEDDRKRNPNLQPSSRPPTSTSSQLVQNGQQLVGPDGQPVQVPGVPQNQLEQRRRRARRQTADRRARRGWRKRLSTGVERRDDRPTRRPTRPRNSRNSNRRIKTNRSASSTSSDNAAAPIRWACRDSSIPTIRTARHRTAYPNAVGYSRRTASVSSPASGNTSRACRTRSTIRNSRSRASNSSNSSSSKRWRRIWNNRFKMRARRRSTRKSARCVSSPSSSTST